MWAKDCLTTNILYKYAVYSMTSFGLAGPQKILCHWALIERVIRQWILADRVVTR